MESFPVCLQLPLFPHLIYIPSLVFDWQTYHRTFANRNNPNMTAQEDLTSAVTSDQPVLFSSFTDALHFHLQSTKNKTLVQLCKSFMSSLVNGTCIVKLQNNMSTIDSLMIEGKRQPPPVSPSYLTLNTFYLNSWQFILQSTSIWYRSNFQNSTQKKNLPKYVLFCWCCIPGLVWQM